MPDVLEQSQKALARRLRALAPVVHEYNRLLAAEEALARLEGSGRRAAPQRRGGRPRTTVTPTATVAPEAAPKARRPARRKRTGKRRSGGRAGEALAIIQEQPGVAIAEIAAKMGINQNYLYRVLPGLQKEGKVLKRGRGWHPRD